MNSWSKAGAYAGLAFVIPIAMYLCYQGGLWLDGQLGTHFLYVAGMMAGFGAGLFELIRQADRIERRGK